MSFVYFSLFCVCSVLQTDCHYFCYIYFANSSAAIQTVPGPAAAAAATSSDYESVVTDIDEKSAEVGADQGHSSRENRRSNCPEEERGSLLLQLHLTFDNGSNLDRQQRKIHLLFSKGETKVMEEPEQGGWDELASRCPVAAHMARLPIHIRQVSRKRSDGASARSITSDLPASPASLASLHSLESELEKGAFPGRTLSPVRMTVEAAASVEEEEGTRRSETETVRNLISSSTFLASEGSARRPTMADAGCQTSRSAEMSDVMMVEGGFELRTFGGEKDPMQRMRGKKGIDAGAQTTESGAMMQDDVTTRVLLEHVGAIERENREGAAVVENNLVCRRMRRVKTCRLNFLFIQLCFEINFLGLLDDELMR